MATVYLAEDLKHHRKVAVKVLHPELAAVLGAERFLAEIRTTANLQHPHILPLHDSGQADGLLFYVMPNVEGETLRARLTREQQLPIEDAVRITREVASALDYAHRHGVIHRDIKPENILLHEGQALIADFGIALAVSTAGGQRMTQTGISLGTPEYMSPEQALGERTVTAKSDVYALGCVLYEMLTGEPPFTGATVQAVVTRVLNEEPRPVHQVRKTVPPNVEAATLHALAKLPADRFATAGEFSHALTQPAAGGLEIRDAGPLRRTDSGPWRRWGPIAAVVAVVALAAAGWALLRLASQGSPPGTRRLLVVMAREQPPSWVQGGDIAVSPDGTKVAYLSVIDGVRRLIIRDWGELTGSPIQGTDGAVTPFFSPSGRAVAFFTLSPDRLHVVQLNGGPPLVLVDSGVVARGGAWGDDGFIYYSNRVGLARVRESGGGVEQVTQLNARAGESAHVYPDVLPNGRGVLFTVRKGDLPEYEVAVSVPGTSGYRTVASGVLARYAASGHLVTLRADRTLVAAPFDLRGLQTTAPAIPLLADVTSSEGFGVAHLSLSRSGVLILRVGQEGPDSSRLVWVDRLGKVEPVDPSWKGQFGTLSLSGDGKRMAVALGGQDEMQDIWVRDLPSGTPRRLVSGATGRPVLSADGTFLTYLSTPQPANALLRIPLGGGTPEQVLHWPTNVWEGLWSSDGEWFVFRVGGQVGTEAGRDVYARRRGDTTTVPILTSAADEKAIHLSPDGRFLAYESDASGRNEVYVRRFPGVGSGQWQVTTVGGREPRWSRQGAELFFRDRATDDMMVASVQTVPDFRIIGVRRLFSARRGESRLRVEANYRAYDVSPDGSRFLMVEEFGRRTADLLLIENWFAELRAKVPR